VKPVSGISKRYAVGNVTRLAKPAIALGGRRK
jgi:hypothetical protein